MPLDTIGSYASSSSSGVVARTARSTDTSTTASSAALSVRSDNEAAETKVSSTGGLAVFVSPFIRLDVETRLAIVEIRNSQTGEVQQQYPSPRAVREYAQNLPDDSDLRTEGGEKQDDKAEPRIIGSASDKAAESAKAQTTGPAPSDSAAPTPAPAIAKREVAIA